MPMLTQGAGFFVEGLPTESRISARFTFADSGCFRPIPSFGGFPSDSLIIIIL
jgi:hypothetical protein